MERLEKTCVWKPDGCTFGLLHYVRNDTNVAQYHCERSEAILWGFDSHFEKSRKRSAFFESGIPEFLYILFGTALIGAK